MHIQKLADRSLARVRRSPLVARLRVDRAPGDSAGELLASVLVLMGFLLAAILA